MSIPYPNKPWEDGQQFKYTDPSGQEIVGTYDAAKNAWSFTRLQEGVPGGGIGFVTTEDVNTTPGVPDAPSDWTGLDLTEDVLNLNTQKQVNWFLSEAIVSNKQELESLLWIGEDSPDERETTYIFWWHTLSLELLVKHNDQWFPVAIPPAQIETLRQEIDAIYDSVGNTRRDIVLNKNDIDTLALDVDGKIATLEEELEQLAPSLERGSWVFTLSHPPGPGEYTMISAFLDETDQEALCDQTYAECQAAGGGDPVAIQACTRAWNDCRNAIDGSQVITTDDWTQCDELVFNNVDMNGVTHGWAGIDSDHYIDVFNMNDENYMVGDIATHGGGTFSFDLVSSRGIASGPASIKIFKSEGEVDLDQYVRKSGDTMTGALSIPSTPTQPDHAANKKYVDDVSAASVAMPIGSIIFWGGTVEKIPSGWVECKGQAAPSSVKELTGLTNIPNLYNYMPAGAGGVFGPSVGRYHSSKILKHSHDVARLEPGNTTGYPNGSKDTSTSGSRYWRGNKTGTGYSGDTITRTSTETGDNITAPPVYTGIYIMKIS